MDALEGGLVVCFPVEEVRGGIALGDERNVAEEIEAEAEDGDMVVKSRYVCFESLVGKRCLRNRSSPPFDPRCVRTIKFPFSEDLPSQSFSREYDIQSSCPSGSSTAVAP